MAKLTGQSVIRREDIRFVTGKGRYTDDLTLPDQAYACFVRSPFSHATLTDIDTSDAETAAGVISVLTGSDYQASGLGTLMCGWMIHSTDGSPMKTGVHPPLAVDKVRHVGDPVAVVIATSKQAARDAAELVVVDYEDLPVIMARGDEGLVHDDVEDNIAFDWELGDSQATTIAFEEAATTVKLDLYNNRLAPVAMETRALNAVYDPRDDRYTLYITSQNPHGLRMTLSAVIGLAPEHRLRVISEDVGGGFGSKAFNYAEEVICTWASRVTGRAIKWTADRGEAFMTDAHGRDQRVHAQLALDSDAKVTALRVSITANMGAYLSTFGSLIPTYMCAPLLSGQYAIPAIYCNVIAIFTNTTPVDAYRGAGRPDQQRPPLDLALAPSAALGQPGKNQQ